MPPAPAMVTSRCSCTSRCTACTSASRPYSGASSAGRLVGVRAASGADGAVPSAACAGAGCPIAFEHRSELVAAPGDRRDHVGAEQLAQRRDLHLQVVLLDHQVRPHHFEQLVLAHHPVAPLDQRQPARRTPARPAGPARRRPTARAAPCSRRKRPKAYSPAASPCVFIVPAVLAWQLIAPSGRARRTREASVKLWRALDATSRRGPGARSVPCPSRRFQSPNFDSPRRCGTRVPGSVAPATPGASGRSWPS